MSATLEIGELSSVEPTTQEIEIEIVDNKTTIEVIVDDLIVEVVEPQPTEIELNITDVLVEVISSNVTVTPIEYIPSEGGSEQPGNAQDYFGITAVDVTNITYVVGGDAEDATETMTFENGVVLTFTYSTGNVDPNLNGLLQIISDQTGKAIIYTRDSEGRYLTIDYTQLPEISSSDGSTFVFIPVVRNSQGNVYSVPYTITSSDGTQYAI
jgi:hypothetical protein